MALDVFGNEIIEEQEEDYIPEKKTKPGLFDYIGTINNKDKYLGDTLSGYNSYIANRALSNYKDCSLIVSEANKFPFINEKAHYDYFYYKLKKSKRFSKWYKRIDPENLDMIKQYFGLSTRKAEEAIKVLSDNDLDKIKYLMGK